MTTAAANRNVDQYLTRLREGRLEAPSGSAQEAVYTAAIVIAQLLIQQEEDR